MMASANFVGSSAATRSLDGDISAAARSDAKVLITGESGVGKEVAAHLIHTRSPRRDMPLCALNCAGLPDTLLESSLFGHVKGSFTDAYRDKPGLILSANRGTLFLDEVGEMSLRMQALLLRFLETGEIQPIGADHTTQRVDARVICATNRNLRERIATGDFREDLYYRLNVIHVHILPLRERPDDVKDLLQHYFVFSAQQHRLPMPTVAPEALDLLTTYHWPGNVRELRNTLERLVVRAEDRRIEVDDLPFDVKCARLPPRESMDEAPSAPGRRSTSAELQARKLFEQMVRDGATFWDVVFEPFDAHDLTRETLRLIITYGLEQAQGRYSALTELFNMEKRDYKRFLNVLRKHDCLVPFHAFRSGRSAASRESEPPPMADRGLPVV
jgi:DNA-binding NtrC family response regulator